MLKKIIFIGIILQALIACSQTEKGPERTQSFMAPREKVWEVLVAVMKKHYPLEIIEDQKGFIRTKTLKGNQFWKAPYQKDQEFFGWSAHITVNLDVSGPVSTVYVYKKVFQQKGFIRAKEEIPSDHVEETVLLYRISKELGIRSRLNRIQ